MDLKQLKPKQDERGTLVEAFDLPKDGRIFYVIVKPHESRGNHYHMRKTERFLCIWGSVIIKVKDRTTGNIMSAELTGAQPIAVTVAPNNIHSFTATSEGAIILVWVDEQLNREDPDTYPEEI